MKILIMGLPGSGKTYLAKRIQPILKAAWYNADIVREMANDWDFSPEGRIRQSLRMKNLADFEKNQGRIVICDFVCPKNDFQRNFPCDYIIWMDTISEGRFEDTNKVFEKPIEYDLRIKEWIGLNQLRKCLEDFSPGTKGIRNFLSDALPKLAK